MKINNLFVLVTVVLSACTTFAQSGKQAESNTDFNFNWRFKLVQVDSQDDYSVNGVRDSDWRLLDIPHDWVIEGEFDSTLIDTAPATGFIYGGGIGWYRKHFRLDLENGQIAQVLFDGVYNHSEVFVNGKRVGEHPYGYSPFYFDITPFVNRNGENVLTVKVDHSRYADSRWYTGAGIYRDVELRINDDVHVPIWGTFITTPMVTSEEAEVNLQVNLANVSGKTRKGVVRTELIDSKGKVIASMDSPYKFKSDKLLLEQMFSVSDPQLWSISKPTLYQAKTSVFVKGELVDIYESNFGIRSIRFDPATGFYLNGENMKIKGVCLHHDGGLVGAAVPKDVWRRRLQVLKDGGANAVRISHNPGSQEFLDLCDEMGFLVQDEFFDEWDNPKDKRLNKWDEHDDYVSRGYAEIFSEWAEIDLKNTMLAHRNHPSIIQWSIGNEIEWTYSRMSAATGFFDNMDWQGNYFWSEPPFSIKEIQHQLKTLPTPEKNIGSTGKMLADWTRELDTTRPVTANCILPSATHETDYGRSLDIVGYSYRRVLYDYGRKHYPDKVIMGTENLPQFHEWKAIMERPWISGTFLWTGIDYMGESSTTWPKKGTSSGLLDLAGYPRGSYHMLKTLWSVDPHIHIATQTLEKSINTIDSNSGLLVAKDPEAWQHALWDWHDVNNHWNYQLGDTISVEVYSNLEELELYLNESSFGKRQLDEFEDHIYKWAVPFSPGTIKLKGVWGNKEITEELSTAGPVYKVSASVDKPVLAADGYSVAHVEVQLVDKVGNPNRVDDRLIEFFIEQVPRVDDVKMSDNPTNGSGGLQTSFANKYSSNIERVKLQPNTKYELVPLSTETVKSGTIARVLGVDNGSIMNVQKHMAKSIITSEGRAILVIQAGLEAGLVRIKPLSNGLESDYIEIKINK